jgi:hypothetical protein
MISWGDVGGKRKPSRFTPVSPTYNMLRSQDLQIPISFRSSVLAPTANLHSPQSNIGSIMIVNCEVKKSVRSVSV